MPRSLAGIGGLDNVRLVRDLLLLAIRLSVILAKLLRPGGVRALAAESLLLKHQLVIGHRCRQRVPNLTTLDRTVLGLITQFASLRRIPNLLVILRPATLFKFHKALVDRKYRLLFSSSFASPKTRSQRPGSGIHRGDRRNEVPQSQILLCAHRAAALSCVRRGPRQGCRAPRARETLPACARRRWPFAVEFHRLSARTVSGAWTCFAANLSC
jgi:hypothetical protein